MGETLTEQRRVSEEGLRIVKLCCVEKMTGRVENYLFDGTIQESHG